ncbi:MAG: hypothetical protein A2Z91_02545 [Deltaproteobacteria bacterium GWA2_38_16]|nr:MAG: hypothetical protein A2Z91_02545 [Deltaproteobacteria bacterium GWA2_38_16]OGQ02073.1 MAG: hypothetical protein A3D19_08840 [Deltaproteobacteria bacterium RIFCSPHIGHO2_02_FULL_38_15]OGQ60514.1 MAG: hypothetical protein A3G92_02695 [Deltaproteobacteria bacterium RIFCSPLOWO2_12_FULL_38_8]
MKKFFLIWVLSLSLLMNPVIALVEAAPEQEGDIPQKPIHQQVYLKSNNAKLYEALKLIDDHSNWLQVSELLREVLASDLEGRYVRDHLKLAKREIDAEFPVSSVRTRILDWPFVVAKLRIIEALMANHARLNVSYDREVPLIKGLLQTYFFPGAEDEGEIIFPDKSSYSFDIYGYVKENVLKTETAPSGVIDDPRFPPVPKPDPKKVPPQVPGIKGQPGEPGSQGQIVRPVMLTPEEAKQQLDFLRSTLQSLGNLLGATKTEIEDVFKVVRLQNQFEPWAMLMQIIANPDSIYSDPQLNDFLQGVKLRLKVGEYDYKPEESHFLKEVLQDQADLGLSVEEEVNSTLGKAALYVTSNLTHGPAMMNIRYIIYLKKFIELYPTASQFGPAVIEFATFLKGLGAASAWYMKFTAYPVRIAGNLVLGAGSVVTKVLENKRLAALIAKSLNSKTGKWLTTNDRYFKIALILTMAADLTEGFIQIYSAVDKYERIDAVQKTVSEVTATSLYYLPMVSQRAVFRYLAWGAFALDVGHRVYSDIPEAHDVIYTVLSDYITDPALYIFTGDTLKGHMVRDYEGQLGISDDESRQALYTFERALRASSNKEELAVSHEAFTLTMKDYANKRLFMIYYLLQRWNNNEVSEMGLMERRYWEDYQQYQNLVTLLREDFRKKNEEFKE